MTFRANSLNLVVKNTVFGIFCEPWYITNLFSHPGLELLVKNAGEKQKYSEIIGGVFSRFFPQKPEKNGKKTVFFRRFFSVAHPWLFYVNFHVKWSILLSDGHISIYWPFFFSINF